MPEIKLSSAIAVLPDAQSEPALLNKAPEQGLGPSGNGENGVLVETLSLGTLPSQSERLLDSEGRPVEKLCSDLTWQPRVLILTSEMLVIAHPGIDEVSDQIPLVL